MFPSLLAIWLVAGCGLLVAGCCLLLYALLVRHVACCLACSWMWLAGCCLLASYLLLLLSKPFPPFLGCLAGLLDQTFCLYKGTCSLVIFGVLVLGRLFPCTCLCVVLVLQPKLALVSLLYGPVACSREAVPQHKPFVFLCSTRSSCFSFPRAYVLLGWCCCLACCKITYSHVYVRTCKYDVYEYTHVVFFLWGCYIVKLHEVRITKGLVV